MNDKEILQRLDEFKSLKSDWDGYGGDEISIRAIEEAKVFVHRHPGAFDFVAPWGGGGLQLEAQREGRYYEVGFDLDEHTWLSEVGGVYDEFHGSLDEVRRKLEAFIR